MEKVRCPGCMKVKDAGTACEYCGYDDTVANAAHQLQIGTVLKEQYQIGRVLGQGGFGITYLGWDLYLDIPVAIKEYYPSGTVMREATVTMNVSDVTGDDGVRFRNNRDRFMREAKMLARFSQVPEIVQIKNFFLANNTAYIVMEYVEGLTLKQYVKNRGGKLSAEETLDILGPIILTLAKVHKTGIIHRDISPDNIMMVSGGAKLLDFGAVRSVIGADTSRELTKSTEAILKQGYAPIEQYQKKGALGPWTDVYALCATICYCMTGEVPPDAPARMLEYEDVDIDGIAGLSEARKKALRHGLELRADRRTPSMEQLYQELFAGEKAEEAPVIAPPARVTEAAIPEERSRTEAEREERPETEQRPKTEQRPMTEPKPRSEAGKRTQPSAEIGKPQEQQPEARRKPKRNLAIPLAVAGVLVALLVAVLIGLNRDTPAGEPLIPIGRENVVSGKCGDTASWTLDLDTGVMHIGGTHMYDFFLEEYGENMVGEGEQKVNRPWEAYTDIITEVIFEDDIYRIGRASFAHCPNLTRVTFGMRLKEIGGDAFWDTGLTEIDLPGSLERIEWCAFEHTQLREVSIPIFVDMIEHQAFGNCPNLTRVEILGSTRWNYDTWNDWPVFCRENGSTEGITLWGPPNGIVEDYANIYGYHFEPMGSGVIFEGLGDFSAYPGNADGQWYFDRESGFLKIEGEMPTDMLGKWEKEQRNDLEPYRLKDVPEVPWSAFTEDIHVVSIGEGVTRICDNAFAHCWNLTDIHFPSTLKSIGFQSFLSTNVDEIILPDSVTEIESFAFNWCRNLRTIKLPMGLEVLRSSTINVTPLLETVYVGSHTEFECFVRMDQQITPFNHNSQPDNNDVDENAMPEHFVIYAPQAEAGGEHPTAREFAENWGYEFREGLFGYEDAEHFGVTVGNISWALRDGVLTLMGQGETPYYRSGNQDANAWHTRQSGTMLLQGEAPWYPYRYEIHTVIVKPGITVLNRGILCDMPNLQWVDLGKAEKIYEGAIDNCGITELVLPDSLVHVHKGAVLDCINLQTIHVHNGSEKMDHGAFLGCDNLQSLYFWSGMENIHQNFDLFAGNSPRDLTVFGAEGSHAQQYAERCGIPFETID